MYITAIIPIGRSIAKDSLTYLSKDQFAPGTIVRVPLRSKKAFGIVISSDNAVEMKAEIKNLSFTIKKLEEKIEAKIDPSFIEAAKKYALYTNSFPGALLGAFINENSIEYFKQTSEQAPYSGGFEEFGLQLSTEDRINIEKGLIRESFAKKNSITIILPTIHKANTYFNEVSKGIENYSLLLHSKLPKKKIAEAITELQTSPQPKLLVTTKEFMPLTRSDTGALLIEEEHSRFYKLERRPYLDFKGFARAFAKEKGIRLINADTLLTTETMYRIKQGDVTEYSRLAQKITHQIKTLIVDTKEKRENKKFNALSDELVEMIRFGNSRGKKIFVFALRRGFSSQTICRDCGTIVLCDNCQAPLSTHKSKSEEHNIFVCHHCGAKRSALETCRVCGSWKLESFGLGAERVVEEIEKLGIKPLLLDKDTVKTDAQMQKKIDLFLNNGGVLVGTEIVLDWLPEGSVDYSAIASIDSLFALPDFRVRERIMHLLIDIKSKATECVLLQGSNTKESVIEQGLSGDLNAFYKEEIGLRANWLYPPFNVFIKLSITDKKEKVREEMIRLIDFFKEWRPAVFPAFIKAKKGNTISHMLLSIPKDKYPDTTLRQKIESLPPSIEVRFDPESLL